MHSQCTKFCSGGGQVCKFCAFALTLLPGMISHSSSSAFPLFTSFKAFETTASQPVMINGSIGVMVPIGSRVLNQVQD